MKIFLLLLCILTSACIKSNPVHLQNIANDKEFRSKGYSLKTPLYNIPFIESYVTNNTDYKDETMRYKMSDLSYRSYYDYDSQMTGAKEAMDAVTNRVKREAAAEYNVKYIFNKNTGDYDVDETSVTTQFQVPELQNKHLVSSQLLGAKTAIPYKNAIAILDMKNRGYNPNEEYFNTMMVQKVVPAKTDDYDVLYAKTSPDKIYMLAGIDITSVVKALRNEDSNR